MALARGRMLLPTLAPAMRAIAVMPRARMAHHEHYGPSWNKKWVEFFADDKLSMSSLHRGLNDVFSHDLVPEPEIVSSALDACRRLNCYATGVRILEALREKAESKSDYDYLVQQLKPTLDKHGIDTPESLGLA